MSIQTANDCTMYLELAVFVVTGVVLLYEEGPAFFRYHFRIAVYYLGLTFFAMVSIPVCSLTPRRVENMVVAARLAQRLSALLGIRWRILGDLGRLRENRSYVVVVNHQHSLDVLALVEMWPLLSRCTGVAKRELMFAGPFGIAAWICGTTFIDRGNRVQSIEILNQKVREAAAADTKVLVFPEGTRHHNPHSRQLLPFKKGAFGAALAAGVPILPIVISHYSFLDAQRKLLEPAKVDIHVLEPIPVDGYSEGDVGKLTELVRDRMLQKFRET